MKKSQLINILKTFSAKEIREMRKWLRSPAHNQRQDVVRLFDFFFEDNHLFKDDCIDKSFVSSWIYPKETYDDAKMRQVMFFLLKAIEDFLVFQEMKKDTTNTKIILSTVYRKRTLNKLFEKQIKSAEQFQQNFTIKNESFYKKEYQLQLEKYTYLSSLNQLSQNIQEVSNTLDIFFLSGKLRQYCLMLSHQSVYQKEYSIGLLQNLLPVIKTEKYMRIPAIAIYFYIFKTLTEKENQSHFFQLKEQISKHGHVFPLGEIRDIYLMAINYCIRKINSGVSNFIRESFELYKQGIENKILIENNIITRATFHNIVSNGLKLKEFKWVKSFVQHYQKYLEEKHRQGFVYYSLARLYYEEKDYDQAMKLLVQEAHYDDIIINLSAKTLLAKMYYEQEEIDVLESLLESMRIYIQRKKVMGYHKNNYKNILRYIKKLLKITPYSKLTREKLQEEIRNASPLTEKEWLLNQLSRN